VEHLFEQKLKKIKKNPKQYFQQMEDLDLQKAIATMIADPKETWKRIKGKIYILPRSYFQND
jgi:hypothetical protein